MNKVEEVLRKVRRKPLLGMAAYTYNPAFVEMMGHLGFDIVWVEMEHAPITFGEANTLCQIASGMGMLTMIRIPDARRENVLRAAECGPDIIDLPMGNSTEQLTQLVGNALYAPEGNRGFFGSSRAVRYGLFGPIAEEQRRINRDICIMSQIETREAVDRAEELCGVPGLSAIFIGLGDLSSSLGCSGDTDNEKVRSALDRAITVAKRHGKLVAIAGGFSQAGLLADKGVDMLFGGSDIACMSHSARAFLTEARDALDGRRSPSGPTIKVGQK